jgi:hypothetical protein
MFNNPMNYELLKSMQQDLHTDEKQRQAFSFTASLVKIVGLASSLFVVGVVVAEHFLA